MTYPLATLSCTLTPAGISAPSYTDVLESLKASFKLIYGADAYVEADSQDGQMLAIYAQGIHDCNMTTVAVYNAFRPGFASGEGLSSIVKINNIARAVPSNSLANLTVAGSPGTTVTGGVAADLEGNRWLLPTFTIPGIGNIIVTASAEVEGALEAQVGTITKILTPTAGWETVTNLTAASPGLPVESDGQLRVRQEVSPALNAKAVISGLLSGLLALSGVTYVRIYENDTDTTDGDGLPSHSIACVVQGGVAAQIAQTIYDKKGPGVATQGNTNVNVADPVGVLRRVKFYIPTSVNVQVQVTLTPFDGYTTDIGDLIKQTLVDYMNTVSVGEDIVVTRLYAPALLNGGPETSTYKIDTVLAGVYPGSVGTADISIGITQRAKLVVGNVTIIVTP